MIASEPAASPPPTDEPLVMVTIRLTRAERHLLRRAAACDGTSMNEWCKSVLIELAQVTVGEYDDAAQPTAN